MHLLNWVDYRTLAAGQLPLAAVFAIVLFGIWRVYPHLRGTDTMALGFSLWLPATALLVAQGNLPLFVSCIGGNLLGICGYVLLYRGVISFLQIKGNLPVLYDVAAVASAVIIYFTTIYDLAVPRLVAMAAVVAVARGLMAVELFKNAKERLHIQLFASFLALFAVLPLCVAAATLSPATFSSGTQASLASIQSIGTFFDVAFLLGCGIFAFTIYFAEISRDRAAAGPARLRHRHPQSPRHRGHPYRRDRPQQPHPQPCLRHDGRDRLLQGHQRDLRAQPRRRNALHRGRHHRLDPALLRQVRPPLRRQVSGHPAGEYGRALAGHRVPFRAALKEPSLPHDQPHITLSIGITQCTFKEPAAEVLARAELALREARSNGRDGACLKFEHEQPVQVPPPANLDRLRTSSRIAKLIGRPVSKSVRERLTAP